jgi:uncharacterized membrane protein YhaH (DUF805 family)
MTITQAISGGFARALDFKGRSRRPDYWLFFAFVFVGAAVLGLLEGMAGGATGGWLVRGFQIVIFVPFMALAWRRLQDTGRPGWYVLVPVAVVVASTLISGSVMQQIAALAIPAARRAPELAMNLPGGVLGALSVLQVVAGAVIIYWMSRPSQRGANAYGPEPRVH